MAYSKTPRFIAGAVCPRCAEMDRLVVYNEDGKDYRECIQCGFKQELHIQPPVREPETRLDADKKKAAEQEQPVKIINFDK